MNDGYTPKKLSPEEAKRRVERLQKEDECIADEYDPEKHGNAILEQCNSISSEAKESGRRKSKKNTDTNATGEKNHDNDPNPGNDPSKLPYRGIFYEVYENKYGGIGVSFFYDDLLGYLEGKGFFKYSKDYGICHITNNIVKPLEKGKVSFIYTFITNIIRHEGRFPYSSLLLQKMASPNFTFLTSDKHLCKLSALEKEFYRDPMDSIMLSFANGFMIVKRDNIEWFDSYAKLPGCIWKSWMSKHLCNPDEVMTCLSNHQTGHFEDFVHEISDHNRDRISQYNTSFGYMLHSYKSRSDVGAVVLCDEGGMEPTRRKPDGRTGKGIAIQALQQFKKLVLIPGKDFDASDNFKWDTVTPDTQIIAIDDLNEKFDIRNLFPDLTDTMLVNRKHLNKFNLLFDESPKHIYTTNHPLQAIGGSSLARLYQVPLYKKFNAEYQPADKYGQMFFGADGKDWSKQWPLFHKWVIEACQDYLRNGSRVYRIPSASLDIQKIIDKAGREFYELAKELIRPGTFVSVNTITERYMEDTEQKKDDSNEKKQIMNRMKSWVPFYCEIFGIKQTYHKSTTQSENGKRPFGWTFE